MSVWNSISVTAKVAKFLKGHPQVEWVHFVGDSDHPGSVRARKYLAGPPALLLFKPKGGTEGAARLVDALAHIGHEANIGYEKTLIIHSFDTTHRLFTPEQKGAARIEEGALQVCALETAFLKIGPPQRAILEYCVAKIAESQISLAEIDLFQHSLSKRKPRQKGQNQQDVLKGHIEDARFCHVCAGHLAVQELSG